MSGMGETFALPYLRENREHHGLSQAELARRSGVSQQTISRIEAGKARATEADTNKLGIALGYPDGFSQGGTVTLFDSSFEDYSDSDVVVEMAHEIGLTARGI